MHRHLVATCLTASALLCALCPRPAAAVILFNEVYVNPPGTDDNREYVELVSSTGGVESMAGLVLLLIDSNGGNTGNIDEAYNLNSYSTGTNGLLMMGNDYDVPVPGPLAGPWNSVYDPATVLKDPSGAAPFSGLGTGDLNNNGFTALLVSGFSSAVGTDLDVDNDNVFDTTPWTALIDSVGWQVGSAGVLSERTYALAVLSNPNFTPDSAARLSSDFTANSAAAWYGGDIGAPDTAYDGAQNFNLPLGAAVTPGSANFPLPIPEPSSLVLALVSTSLLIAAALRRRRL